MATAHVGHGGDDDGRIVLHECRVCKV